MPRIDRKEAGTSSPHVDELIRRTCLRLGGDYVRACVLREGMLCVSYLISAWAGSATLQARAPVLCWPCHSTAPVRW